MFRSLAFKWTVTLILTGLIGVILAGIFAYRTTTTEFDRLLTDQAENDFVEMVQAYYQTYETWDGIEGWLRDEPEPGIPDDRRREPPFVLADTSGLVVSGHPPVETGERIPTHVLRTEGLPITVAGEQVGTALLIQPPELDPREQRYIEQTNRALLIGAAGASATALLVGLLLTRQFLRPLSDLTRAITAMRSGDLEQRVAIRSNDELGTLAQTFNEMSANLTRANQLRRQMTADIAHDLRTPLTVISGYLEALQDTTLKPTPERFGVMREEVTLLQRLVEDLRTLSLADAGELKLTCEAVAPVALLERVTSSFQASAADAGIRLTIEASPSLSDVWVDSMRMAQALGNLVANALRHTPHGGTITLAARQTDESVTLDVQDTGVGIAPDELPNIFERFYRSDPSRQSDTGESGLGLAITRSIVEAHGGTISADSTLGVGTTITIRLPSYRA